jgi:release factor glutamine methyltransferase
MRDGDLRCEPASALQAGADGLAAIRRIVAGAPGHLRPGGWLLFEHGYDQAQACRDLLAEAGLVDLITERDLAGIARVSGGRWSGAASLPGAGRAETDAAHSPGRDP